MGFWKQIDEKLRDNILLTEPKKKALETWLKEKPENFDYYKKKYVNKEKENDY